MQTLLLGIVIAAAPLAAVLGLLGAVLGLLAWTSRRARRRGEVVARQIALTDAVHERLGAVVAPVVRRRRRGGWQVRIAVPFERPAVTEALQAIVLEAFAPLSHDPRSVEMVLTRQSAAAGTAAATPAGARNVEWAHRQH
jgi:hypothetical protein